MLSGGGVRFSFEYKWQIQHCKIPHSVLHLVLIRHASAYKHTIHSLYMFSSTIHECRFARMLETTVLTDTILASGRVDKYLQNVWMNEILERIFQHEKSRFLHFLFSSYLPYVATFVKDNQMDHWKLLWYLEPIRATHATKCLCDSDWMLRFQSAH